MGYKAIMINKKDNVTTAVTSLARGTNFYRATGTVVRHNVAFKVSRGHKFALQNIESGDPVFKYSEGQWNEKISLGEYMHVHNVASSLKTQDNE